MLWCFGLQPVMSFNSPHSWCRFRCCSVTKHHGPPSPRHLQHPPPPDTPSHRLISAPTPTALLILTLHSNITYPYVPVSTQHSLTAIQAFRPPSSSTNPPHTHTHIHTPCTIHIAPCSNRITSYPRLYTHTHVYIPTHRTHTHTHAHTYTHTHTQCPKEE